MGRGYGEGMEEMRGILFLAKMWIMILVKLVK